MTTYVTGLVEVSRGFVKGILDYLALFEHITRLT